MYIFTKNTKYYQIPERDLLEKFQGRFEAAKAEILNLCSKYDVDIQTDSDMATVGENLSDDEDDDISEAERLRKRR